MTKSNDAPVIPEILEEITFQSPNVVSSLFHPKKKLILETLVKKEMTIYDLKKKLDINPGIIKRHIVDLVEKGLVIQLRQERNKMGMNLKYYRAVAKKFKVNLVWSIE